MNIYQRLNEVRKVVRKIKKTADVSAGGGSYKAVTYDYMVSRLHSHMVKHGIMVVPSVRSMKTEQNTGMSTKNGVPYIRVEVELDVRFVNCDDPNDLFEVSVFSHGIDNNDKAPQKAITAGVKQALLKVLLLETGEKDEDRPTDAEGSRIKPEERTKLYELCDSLSIDRAYLDRLAVALGFADSSELPKAKMDYYAEMMRKKAGELTSIAASKDG
jgi:hypothetical protein